MQHQQPGQPTPMARAVQAAIAALAALLAAPAAADITFKVATLPTQPLGQGFPAPTGALSIDNQSRIAINGGIDSVR